MKTERFMAERINGQLESHELELFDFACGQRMLPKMADPSTYLTSTICLIVPSRRGAIFPAIAYTFWNADGVSSEAITYLAENFQTLSSTIHLGEKLPKEITQSEIFKKISNG